MSDFQDCGVFSIILLTMKYEVSQAIFTDVLKMFQTSHKIILTPKACLNYKNIEGFFFFKFKERVSFQEKSYM